MSLKKGRQSSCIKRTDGQKKKSCQGGKARRWYQRETFFARENGKTCCQWYPIPSWSWTDRMIRGGEEARYSGSLKAPLELNSKFLAHQNFKLIQHVRKILIISSHLSREIINLASYCWAMGRELLTYPTRLMSNHLKEAFHFNLQRCDSNLQRCHLFGKSRARIGQLTGHRINLARNMCRKIVHLNKSRRKQHKVERREKTTQKPKRTKKVTDIIL